MTAEFKRCVGNARSKLFCFSATNGLASERADSVGSHTANVLEDLFSPCEIAYLIYGKS